MAASIPAFRYSRLSGLAAAAGDILFELRFILLPRRIGKPLLLGYFRR